MTTIADIRANVRTDLHDTDPASERWSDAELDRHIEHALNELNLHIPQELTATLATTPGSRDLSLASLAGLISVEAVEFPAGEYPPANVGFRQWGGAIVLESECEPAGEDATVRYLARHTVDAVSSTLPVFLEEILAMGAGAFAVLERAGSSIDELHTGGELVPANLASWARARETAFRQLLFQFGRNKRLRARRPLARSR